MGLHRSVMPILMISTICYFCHKTSRIKIKLSSYLLPKFSRVPFTISSRISATVNGKELYVPLVSLVNGTLLNFGKRNEDDLKGHF